MYQTVGHHAIHLYAEAMGVPLYRRIIQGSSVEQDKVYESNAQDEVEDLFELLKSIQVTVVNQNLDCTILMCLHHHHHHHPILIWVIPVNGGGQIYPTLTAISQTPTLHLARFMASLFSKPTLSLSFSTCFFHIFFGRKYI